MRDRLSKVLAKATAVTVPIGQDLYGELEIEMLTIE